MREIILHRRSRQERSLRGFGTAMVLAIAVAGNVAAVGCGGGGQKAKAPTAETSTTPSTQTQSSSTPTAAGEQAIALDPQTKLKGAARSSFEGGVSSFNQGDLNVAAQSFQAAVQAEPQAYEAQYALGMTYEKMGRNSEALDHYRDAYKLKGDYEPAVSAYALLLYKQGSKGEAETFLTDQQAKYPKAVGIMTALAEVKSLQGDSNGAQNLASSALTLDPKYEPAMVLIARDHFRRGRIDLASYVLGAVLDGQKTQEEKDKGLPAKTNPARAPNNAEALMLRGMILQRQGERLVAAKYYENAVKIRPDLSEAQLQLGLIRLEANDADGALDPLRKAVTYNSASIETHLALGEAYRLTAGHAADAKREYTWVSSAAGAPAQLKALASYNLGLLYFLSPGIDGLSDPARYDRAIDYLNQFRAAKGAASGPSWPADAEDLVEQARRAKSAASAAGTGGGTAAPKAAVPDTASSAAAAGSATAPKAATSAGAAPSIAPPTGTSPTAAASASTTASKIPAPAASASVAPPKAPTGAGAAPTKP